MTAHHESGHAVVSYHLPGTDPIHKATIIPRGGALGMLVRLPEGDRVSISREKLISDISVAMGGRIAEEMMVGADKITTGASSDFRMATKIARCMVMDWGMSETLGPLSYTQDNEVYHPMFKQESLSEEITKQIDREIRKIVDQAYTRAKDILTLYQAHLELVAQYLFERETLTGEEITVLLTEGKLSKPEEEKPKAKVAQLKAKPVKRKPSVSKPKIKIQPQES